MGVLARWAVAPARALDRRGAGDTVAAGGQPGEERQPDQLPLGPSGLWRSGPLGVALGLGRGRRRSRALFPGRPCVQRFRFHRAVPALAGRAARHHPRPPSRDRPALACRRAVRRPAGRRGANLAGCAFSESHAVDAADVRRRVLGGLAGGPAVADPYEERTARTGGGASRAPPSPSPCDPHPTASPRLRPGRWSGGRACASMPC
jgi:hypothetical protein